VQASATSQAASVANHPVSQKADANRADEDSPFAQLLEMAAPKETDKPSQRDAADSRGKPANDKPAANQDDKAGATQAQPRPKDKTPAKNEKADKSDKSKTEAAAKNGDEATDDMPDDSQIAAVDPRLLNPQALPPAPPAPIVAMPADGKSDDMPVELTAAAAPAAANLPIDAAASAAAASPAPAQGDDSQAEESEPASPPLTAQLDVKPSAPGKDNAKSMAARALAKSAADNAPGGKPDVAENNLTTSEIARATVANDNAVKDAPAKGGVPKDEISKDALSKDDGVKPAEAAKDHLAQSDIAAGNADKVDAGKMGEQQANLPPRESENIANTPKATSQPVQAADMLLTNNRVAAPQPPLPVEASTQAVAQHVQVSAQPNVPALAVEIAAKSQSGAKQFDIRLDPPELGRVEVRLSIDATGKASAHLSADRPETLTLLQKDSPILTRALREAGLDVSQDGLNFSLRQQADGGNANNGGRRGASRAFSLTATASIDATATTAAYRGRSDGRLDIRV
jgi:flagellar hook-length control protein FliK